MNVKPQGTQLVGWRTLSSVFADVLISPWNLLIGGLLSHFLPFFSAILSLLVGYMLLALTMFLYGGLGFQLRKQTYDIIEPVFGKKGSNYFFSAILALGQIGWFGIICEIGGVSLANIFQTPSIMGIIIYTALMILMASLNLHNLGIVKAIISMSSLTLIAYLLITKSSSTSFESVVYYQPETTRSILWGIGAVFASLISFTSVSPDFLSQVKTQKDILFSVITGVFFPGFLIGSLGIFLFHNFEKLQMAPLIGTLALPLFGNIFNIFTNTDATIAIYTPGLAFSHIFGIKHWHGIVIGGVLGCLLAILGITQSLQQWLTFLSAVYPAIIGLTLAYYLSARWYGIQFSSAGFEWTSILIVVTFLICSFFIDLSLLGWLSIVLSFLLAFFFRIIRHRTQVS